MRLFACVVVTLAVVSCGARTHAEDGNVAVCAAFHRLEGADRASLRAAARRALRDIKAAQPTDSTLRQVRDGVLPADDEIAVPAPAADGLRSACEKYGVSLRSG